MLSCVNDTRKVVQAMRLGAIDYLTKPFQKAELDAAISQVRRHAKGESYAGEVEELCDDVFFVAASPAMKKIRSQAALVANVDIPVLLLGESGTGKEVLARLIHKLSPRAHRTFLKVNCAAVPADLLESELFGYEAGAFTGANSRQAWQVRTVQQGHHSARRNRRNAAVLAGQAAARSAGSDFLAPGQPHRDQSRCAHPGRDQHQYSRSARQQAPARGSLLPAERVHHVAASAARSQGRNSHPAEAFHVAHVGILCASPVAAFARL
jgi:CheY-like chemotaxis protein